MERKREDEAAHAAGEAKPTGKRKMKWWQILLLNIGAMLVIGVVLVWLVMLGLDRYTRHDESFGMPDIVGLSLEEATAELAPYKLNVEVSDSIYNEQMPRGVILESTPRAGAKIKGNRTIFVMVNKMEVKQSRIPDVVNNSRRQGEALLRANGFVNLEVVLVAGEHNDAIQRLKDRRGRILEPGDRLPYNELIILEVSSRELWGESLRDSLISDVISQELDLLEGE